MSVILLRRGATSHWHRVDAAEIWHCDAGALLILRQSPTEAGPAIAETLGPNLAKGQHPQRIVPAGYWQSAATTGDWTLRGCTVSPGFRFEEFAPAPPGFDIPGRGTPPNSGAHATRQPHISLQIHLAVRSVPAIRCGRSAGGAPPPGFPSGPATRRRRLPAPAAPPATSDE